MFFLSLNSCTSVGHSYLYNRPISNLSGQNHAPISPSFRAISWPIWGGFVFTGLPNRHPCNSNPLWLILAAAHPNPWLKVVFEHTIGRTSSLYESMRFGAPFSGGTPTSVMTAFETAVTFTYHAGCHNHGTTNTSVFFPSRRAVNIPPPTFAT